MPRYYITVKDIQDYKVELDDKRNVIIKNLPIYKIVDKNEKDYTFIIENIVTRQRYKSGIGNMIKVSEVK
jgi:dsRNA-specific ribonuclease